MERDKSRVSAVEMKFRIKEVTSRDENRNENIKTELSLEPVQEYIEQRQLEWWGHLQRLNKSVLARKVWESKITWDNTTEKILNKKDQAKLKTRLIFFL